MPAMIVLALYHYVQSDSILAVLILGMVYSTEGNFTTTAISEVSDSVELGKLFLYEIPKYLERNEHCHFFR